MKILSGAISLSCLLLVTSCATYDPYTGEQEVSKAGKGAGIGAGVAAVVAYLANKDKDSGNAMKEYSKLLRVELRLGAVLVIIWMFKKRS
jgi:hypothetical protein